mgnify:CR=1 FL=1
MKKKGFTLIELLAVIVVLAVIALIATPIVLNLVKTAKIGAAEQSVTGYVKSIENTIIKSMVKEEPVQDGNYKYNSLKVDISGKRPTSGKYTVKNGKVESGNFCVDGYYIEYKNGQSKYNKDKECVNEVTVLEKAEKLVYSNGTCKTDGTTYNYMGGCYIKGANESNYIWYNGFMWRIMGINSDGTVRLINAENVTVLPQGVSSNKDFVYATSKGYINDWLNDYFYNHLNDTKSIIKEGNYFCSETTNETEITAGRTTCTSGNEINAKVGIISADEYLLADSASSYLNIEKLFWTMTPYGISSNIYEVFSINNVGELKYYSSNISEGKGIRPIINVDSESIITNGDGTLSKYFVLVEDKSIDNNNKKLKDITTSGEYVNLEGNTYRVVSKDDDGIKLVLDGSMGESTYGKNNTFSTSSGIGEKLNTTILNKLNLSNSDKIVETTWYQGEITGWGPKYTDTLKEINSVSAKVGLMRIGEMLSGQSFNKLSGYYWTLNKMKDSYSTTQIAWLITNPCDFSIGYINNYSHTDKSSDIRPVIKVKNEITVMGGNGTWNNPYEI